MKKLKKRTNLTFFQQNGLAYCIQLDSSIYSTKDWYLLNLKAVDTSPDKWRQLMIPWSLGSFGTSDSSRSLGSLGSFRQL
jgi:hypothetical protein